MGHGIDALFLARAQFAFTLGFHIVLPAFSIGLASYLMVLEALWLRTGRQVYLDVFQYWLKIFAISFAMGVVSGVVMSYEFGTNWARVRRQGRAGHRAADGLRGADRVLPGGGLPRRHAVRHEPGRPRRCISSRRCSSPLGTLMSAFWILSANSWMQTPQGFTLHAGRPLLPGRLVGGDLQPVLPVPPRRTWCSRPISPSPSWSARSGAYHLLRDRQNVAARTMFSMAMWMAVIVAPIQIIAGDQHGLNTLRIPAGQDRGDRGRLRPPSPASR